MSKPMPVDSKSFEDTVLKSSQPVLVDFWAPWCGPCKMVAPIVEDLAQEYDGKVGFVKLNTDEDPDVAARYGIRSIPTLIIFKGGKPFDQVVGFRPKSEPKRPLDKALV